MGIPGADRFLNCVLNRSGKDTVMKTVVLMLVALGTPIYMVYGITKFQVETEQFLPEPYFSVVLLMGIIAAYLIYAIVRTMVQHLERDEEWMSSLIDYASCNGKDTLHLSEILRSMTGLANRNYERAAFYLFITVAVIYTMLAITYLFIYIEDHVLVILEVFTTASVLLILGVVSGIVHDRMGMIDILQCRFTKEFSEMMCDGEHYIGTMSKGKWVNNPLMHTILTLATLGFYSVPFTLWTVHRMNLHIKVQWDYERSVLEWMASRDGAIDVTKVEKESRKGLLNYIRRAI